MNSSRPEQAGATRTVRAWWQAGPFAAVFVLFFLAPLALVLAVSFWNFNEYQLIPAFTLRNYLRIFEGCAGLNARGDLCVTFATYLSTLKFCFLVWAITLVVGFAVAYFLAFHVRSATVQTALFVLCTIPFWTSNVIRMISWIPFLGRNGLANTTLLQLGLIKEPLEFLLFSDFAVVLAYVHLYTLFMVVPIFNSMMRIDRSLLEAARDGGASGWQTLRFVIVPLCKPGIAIGSIFIVTIVMGDFVTVRMMSGGQSASVSLMMVNAMSLLQYPAAAANAVVLLLLVLFTVAAMMRMVDIRKEL